MIKCKIDMIERDKKKKLKIIDIVNSGFLIFQEYDIIY